MENQETTSSMVEGKHLLVVDDDVARFSGKQRLCGACISICAGSSGLFETHSGEIDSLITDQTMPDVTGKELIVKR